MVYQPGRGIPIYLQLADLIREQIELGELQPGDMAPSEMQLRDEHNVSRATAAKALDHLAALGFVRRRPGIGSVIEYRPGPKTLEVRPGTIIRARLQPPGSSGALVLLSVTPPGEDEQTFDAAAVIVSCLARPRPG